MLHSFKDFKDLFIHYQHYFNQLLENFLKNSPIFPDLKEVITYSLLAGGKRLRPILVLFSNNLCLKYLKDSTKSNHSQHIHNINLIAIAIEMLHTYSLIHDDLPAMDNDSLRRGLPTSHIKFGESKAILAGDTLLNEAFELLSSIQHLPILQVIHLIAKSTGSKGMIKGQLLDLKAEKQQLNLQDLENIHLHKTAALIESSILSPVIYYEINEIILPLKEYSQSIGLAFQIIDDILDVTENSQTLGKNAASDIKNQKVTYVTLLGLKKAQEKAQELVNQATLSIQSINCSGKESQVFIDLANYILNRNH